MLHTRQLKDNKIYTYAYGFPETKPNTKDEHKCSTKKHKVYLEILKSFVFFYKKLYVA